MIRSNSPETVNSEGIVYQETAVGDMRFMIHHVNNLNKNVKMYVIATNKNSTPVTLRQDYLGFAGPSPIATAKRQEVCAELFPIHAGRFEAGFSDACTRRTETGYDGTERCENEARTCHFLYSDMYSDLPIQFDVVMIDEIRSIEGFKRSAHPESRWGS